MLVAVYAIFAIAATARATVQLVTRYAEAPTAYLLSAAAAVIYIVATITLALGTRTSRLVALVAISFELLGVLVVGTLSLLDAEAFPRATVWSGLRDGVRVRTAGPAVPRTDLALADPPAPEQRLAATPAPPGFPRAG